MVSLAKNKLTEILVRYIILVLLGLFNLWIFYLIFTPLTVWIVFFILGLFYDAALVGNNIVLVNNSVPIELIKACIAGSAYYLLFILNLSTRDITLSKRINFLILSFLAFLILNVLRIVILSAMAISGSSFFNITHILFWYALSTVFVVAIWFVGVHLFKVRTTPFYSDIKFLFGKIKK